MGERISVKVKPIRFGKIKRRLEDLNEDTTLKLAIHSELERYCEPYVPYLHGPLSQTTEVTADYVKYTQPYAHYQYHGLDFNHTLDVHPLASAEWDKAMMRDHKREFTQQVKDLIVWRYRQLYG